MAMNDTLAMALSTILNAEKVGKPTCIVHPISKTAKAVLEIMKVHHFIGEFTPVDDGKGGFIDITLIGGVNKCGAIKPRFAAKVSEYGKFEKRFLPSKDFGMLIVSTPKGIMTQNEAKEKNLGGKLLAFVY